MTKETARVDHTKAVVSLYDNMQWAFDAFWSRLYLRYGFWDDQTHSRRQALENVDRYVADRLHITRSDVVLDAGCGVGGTAIYLAERHECKVVGINTCEPQLNRARKQVSKRQLDSLISFENCDFCDTALEAGSFSKVAAIESIYHCADYPAFADEMFRLLRPGGRIAIVDRFRVKSDLLPEEQRLYDKYRQHIAVSSLETVDRLRTVFESAGFRTIEFVDQLSLLARGIGWTHFSCLTSWPLSRLLTSLRVIPSDLHRHTVSLMVIRKLFHLGVITFGTYLFEKPE